MKKLAFLIISIVIGILVSKKSEEIIIPYDAIRVRIIANSDNISDLYEKKKIKEEIKKDLYNLVKEAENSDEASLNIRNNLNNIKRIVSQKTNDFKISYGNNYFPKKIYRGIIYPEGEYESLVITLGAGLGENWWCVLYPPLCMIDDDNTSDIEYHSLALDLLKN